MKPLPVTTLFFTICVAGLIVTTLSGCAGRFPAAPDDAGAPIFRRMDTNHDGKVSRAEFSAGFADAVLAAYDQPRTGSVTAEQWNGIERAGKRSVESFSTLDANKDGKLTRDELNAGPQRDAIVNRIFDRIDKDHDGFISVEEGRPSGLDRTPQQRAEGTGL